MMEGRRHLDQGLQKGLLRLLALQPDNFPVFVRLEELLALVTAQPFGERFQIPVNLHSVRWARGMHLRPPYDIFSSFGEKNAALRCPAMASRENEIMWCDTRLT